MALAVYVAWPIAPATLDPGPVVSLRITDRRGRLLREVLSDREGRSRWLRIEQLPPAVRLATLAAEDHRFEHHFGIDPLALARAAWSNLKARRIVSGGSTLTQQLASILLGTGRSLPGKLHESLYALRLEAQLDKGEILEQVLNRTGYGNQCYGIEAAARLYFGRSAAALSLGQAAALAVLPRSPARYDPYRHPERVAAAQRGVLLRLRRLGWIGAEALERARREALGWTAPQRAFLAPHFCDAVRSRLRRAGLGSVREVRTTLDLDLQLELEGRLRAHVQASARRGISNAAALILDHASGEVLALAGSVDYFDPDRAGMVNGATARRQPGSALKPLVYALALERGHDLAERVHDAPLETATPVGSYRPRNYDGRYHGWVSLRTALACSYNVPAIRLAQQLGVGSILRLLRRAGFASLSRSPSHYGLGLALGGGEVTLLELTRAYAGLARQGELPPLVWWRKLLDQRGRPLASAAAAPGAEPGRFLGRRSAYAISAVLADPDARRAAFGSGGPLELPFPCAAKTGTSEGYRDNWTIGFTPRHTVGVWAGNFDGRPMRSASGISGAAPLFRELMLLLWQRGGWEAPDFPRPPGLEPRAVCPASGGTPGPGCPTRIAELFFSERPPPAPCSEHARSDTVPVAWRPLEHGQPRRTLAALEPRGSEPAARMAILSPRAGDVFAIDPILRREYQVLRLAGAAPPAVERLEWWVDGWLLAEVAPPFEADWPLEPGRHRIELVGQSASALETARIDISVRD